MAELDSILSGKGAVASEPVVEEQVEAPEAQAAPETDIDEQAGQGDEQAGQKMVPHEALHAEKQKVKRYTEQVADFERKLAEQNTAWERRFEQLIQTVRPQPQQEKPPAPDFWENPDAYLTQKLTPVQQQMQQQREEFSLMMANEKYGAEAVQEAYRAIASEVEANPAARAHVQAIMQTPHPYGALVDWHRKRQAAAEIGDDPAAYRERLKAELLAEMQGAAPAAATPPVMPSNLAGARNVGSRSGPAWSGPQSLNDIFDRRSPKP